MAWHDICLLYTFFSCNYPLQRTCVSKISYLSTVGLTRKHSERINRVSWGLSVHATKKREFIIDLLNFFNRVAGYSTIIKFKHVLHFEAGNVQMTRFTTKMPHFC
jgi:hypothetical protein